MLACSLNLGSAEREQAELGWELVKADGVNTWTPNPAAPDRTADRDDQVGYSGSWGNSYEIVEFVGDPGQSYTIRIRRWSGTDATWFGIAWTVTGGLLNPVPMELAETTFMPRVIGRHRAMLLDELEPTTLKYLRAESLGRGATTRVESRAAVAHLLASKPQNSSRVSEK